MESRYIRNRIYLTEKEQKIIKNYPILLAGAGIGSVIAETALRLGFENITIIDGDEVEKSNLNRQNYTEYDVSQYKVIALKKRLKAINKNAKITIHKCYLDKINILNFIKGHKVAVNALDFSTDVPLVFDKICQDEDIPILHPYNLGWGGLVTVIAPDSLSLSSIVRSDDSFDELNVVQYASNYLNYWGNSQKWIDDIIKDYKKEAKKISPPQLSIGSWILAAISTHLLFNIATNKEIKKFPEFYLSTIMNN